MNNGSQHAAALNSGKDANLDLLRSVAVLLVLGSHVVMALGFLDHPWSERLAVRELAQLGVLLFFIHTSLVLMMSLHRMQADAGGLAVRFYLRRLFRIYPLALLTVAVAVLYEIPPHFEPNHAAPTLNTYIANLLLVQNLTGAPDIVGPMWSLPLEVQMYVVLPLVFLVARRIHSYAGAVLLAAAGFVVWYVDAHVARAFGTTAVLEYAPWFFMGCAAYPLYRFAVPRAGGVAYGACLAAFVASPALLHALMDGDYRIGWVRWAIGASFALSLPHFAQVRSAAVRRWSYVIATHSYGIYLAHVPILWFAFHKLPAMPLAVRIAVFAVLMIAVPAALYRTLERPFIRMGVRIAERASGPAVQVPATATG